MNSTLTVRPGQGRNCTGSRTEPKPQLTDEQWLLIADLFPYRRTTPLGGRPPVEPRRCLEGILWMLRLGARWKDLPLNFPSPSTCWRRLKEWTESGVFQRAWARLLRKLRRYKRRYKVERSISWLFNRRRLLVRPERYAHLFLGFVQLACACTILNRF